MLIRAFLKGSLLVSAMLPLSLVQSHFNTAWAEPPAEMFGQVPRIYDAALSPNNEKMASITNVKGQYFVMIKSVKAKQGEKPKLLGLSEGVKPSYIKWVNDNQVFVVFWQSQMWNNTPIRSSFIYTVDATTMKGKILIRPKNGLFRQFNSTVVDWLEDDPD